MNGAFENVIRYYYNDEKSSNLFDYTNRNLGPIKKWLGDQMKINDVKDSKKSDLIRKEGNVFYKEKSLQKSMKSYNRSICCAPDSSEEYFLASANRSAVTYELGKYEHCLKDIESCLNSYTYPKNLKLKLQFRKVECLKKLGRSLESQELLKNIGLSKNGDKSRDVEDLSIGAQVEEELLLKNVDMYKLPMLAEGENPNFANASSKIEMRYNEQKGRHAVAKKDILKGEILFLEKAFAFGCIFDEYSGSINVLKCYHCLKSIYSGIPCKCCTKCIFCDSKCRDTSWERSHRWECRGMLGDIWYHLGIAFPAFRALLKGINSSFREFKMDDIKCFGNKEDNYPFFNSLVYERDNKHLEVSIMSVTVITYLREYTNYFEWFLSQPKNGNWSMEEITKFFELQLCKHILQFQNNSSIIEHWPEEERLPLEREPVACGIFPSVSIMNHSCKPNITNYFVCDTIVVKSLEDIKQNEEIYNCYGIYYRDMNKDERQNTCAQLYHFECKCMVCSDPGKEMDAFDTFICMNCGCDIPKANKQKSSVCKKCGFKINYKELKDMYRNIEINENENDVNSLHNSLVRRKKLLNRYHSDLQSTYFKLYQIYKEIGNYRQMLGYFEKWFKVEKFKIGQDVQLFGTLLYEIGSLLMLKFDARNNKEDLNMISKAQDLMTEAKQICTLHYPAYIIDRICWN